VAGFGGRGGGPVFGTTPFTHVRTGSLTLSTLSRGAGQFGSGHSAGAPGGVAQALGAAGWGGSADPGRPTGPPQHSQSMPATPTLLMDSASGVAAGGRFVASAAQREPHGVSAPVLPTALSSGHQPQDASANDGSASPSAPAAARSAAGSAAAGEERGGSGRDAEPHPAAATPATADQQLQPGAAAAKQPSRGPSATDGSGSGGGSAQPRQPGLRKNKFSSFSSDLPPDQHWPPGATSSA
jgi:hypothetical protein